MRLEPNNTARFIFPCPCRSVLWEQLDMKRFVTTSLIVASLGLFAISCKNTDSAKTTEQIQALEKRVEALEKRPSFPQRQMPPTQESAYQLPTGSSYVLGNKAAP